LAASAFFVVAKHRFATKLDPFDGNAMSDNSRTSIAKNTDEQKKATEYENPIEYDSCDVFEPRSGLGHLVSSPSPIRRSWGGKYDESFKRMGGWMGGGMWLWTVIGIMVVVLLVVIIGKMSRK
jgi:hypothetical protein